jgi:hypothetical protein
MSMAKLLLVIILPFVLYADTCVVASGQTVAFNLSAGSKASWNNPTTGGVRQIPALSKKGISFSVYQLSNGNIAFKALGLKNDAPSTMSLFCVNGRKIGTLTMNDRTSGEFRTKLVPGIYFARLEVNETILKTSRFMVGR